MIKQGGRVNIRPANWSDEFVASDQFKTKIMNGRKSIIGHPDLATILDVECNRESITLNPGDSLLVAQVVNGRLPVGTQKVPDGVQLKFFFVEIEGELTPWTSKFDSNSIFGSMLKMGKKVASLFNNGEANAMQDSYGNFIVEIDGLGFHGTLWDE
jgi:hypothetical protein